MGRKFNADGAPGVFACFAGSTIETINNAPMPPHPAKMNAQRQSRKSAVTPSTSQAYLPCAYKIIHKKYDEGEGVNFGSDSPGMEEKPDAQKPGLRKPTPP